MSAAVAHARGAASSHEARSWPHDVDHSPELSIGRVVDALEEEFPAISLSKVRYLESEGLVAPARTGSGYRKYSAADVERLRYVLTEQRDSFTPLSVIRAQLDALDAGHTPTRRRVAQVVSSEGQTVSLGGRRAIPAADLADLTGVDMETLERYTRLGLITPDLAGYFPARCVQTVSAIARLECAGVDVRVLRAVRQGAERSADIIDQTVSSQRGRGRGADRERARARAVELGELFAELHREMLTVAVSALADDGD